MAKQEKKDKTKFLGLLLLLLAGFFVFLFLLPEGKKSNDRQSRVTQAKEFEEKVNKHLFHTSQDMQMSREKMQIEADKIERQGVGAGKPKEENHKLDFSADPRAEALIRELGRDAKETAAPTNADEQVQTELFEAEQAQEYSEAYKREYARQFVENARKAGYLIKLNDDYKVISVKPLRKPADSFELFNKNHDGGVQ
jgi:hypothetical protein